MDLDVVDLREGLSEFYGALGYASAGATAYPDATRTKKPVHLIHMTKPLDETGAA